MSEFWSAVDTEFGAVYGRILVRDQVLGALDHRSAQEALDAGVPPQRVWLALCEANDVPAERRYGVGRPQNESASGI